MADQLRIKDVEKGRARVMGGKEIDACAAKLNYVQVGPYRKEGWHAGIVDHEGSPVAYQGLPGMNFLTDLEYNIDFEKQRIVWKR